VTTLPWCAQAPRFVQISASAVHNHMLRCLRERNSRYEGRQRTTTSVKYGPMQPGINTETDRTNARPTPHADVNTLLRALHSEVTRILDTAPDCSVSDLEKRCGIYQQ
jgi:hypothetical protein